jgi:protein-disulfide isomerase
VTTAGGSLYIGSPWVIAEETGATIEEKVRNFAWNRMQSNVSAVVDREHPREPGLFPITIQQTVESGKLPLEGFVDRDGKIVLLGNLYPANGDPAAARAKALQPFMANAPARGAASAPVTIVEFSDFQCPSCKHASHFGESILARYGDSVRYVRYDLPLVQSHPWALGAAMAGRAIYRQKPTLFWEYKKDVYENQEKLSAFTFYDFARGWAEDHGLDMGRYDSDMGSQEIRVELLNGAGAAFSNDVRATPTYMVNGVFVDAGDEAKALDAYVGRLLK